MLHDDRIGITGIFDRQLAHTDVLGLGPGRHVDPGVIGTTGPKEIHL